MIDFEVGSVFRVVDDATGPLRKILEAVREVTKAVKLARTEMQGFGAAVAPGIGGAIAETNKLAGSWTRAAEASVAAARVMNESAAKAAAAARTAATVSVPSVARGAAAAAVGGGGGFRPGIGGAHITGPGVPLPGGSHLRLGGNAAMVGAGAIGYGIYEDAQLLKDIHWINYHLGRKDTKENVAELRKIIEDAMKDTGMPMRDIAKAATEEARLLKGTPGETSGAAVLPEFLRGAASEALAKDVTMQESMKALIGMAHMVKAYKPEEIKSLFSKFAYLSTANPASLAQMERAFSYAVPILQSGADVPWKDTALLGTALATAGVTSSKSGTWLREMVVRMMPGDDTTKGGHAHNVNLRELGLLDANNKPTWFTGGKPDPAKALEIAGPIAAQLPPEQRLPVEMDMFGRRGAGAFSVLGDAKVLERIKALRKEMESEGTKNRYESLLEDYRGTAVGTARTTLGEFNVSLMRLGDTALPAATAALGVFSGVLKGLGMIQGAAPRGPKPLGLPMQREALPKAWNYFFGPKEGEGVLKPQPQSFTDGPMRPQPMNFLQGPPPITLKPQQIAFSLNVDGHVLAQAVIEKMEEIVEHATGSPNYNGLSAFPRADGGVVTG